MCGMIREGLGYDCFVDRAFACFKWAQLGEITLHCGAKQQHTAARYRNDNNASSLRVAAVRHLQNNTVQVSCKEVRQWVTFVTRIRGTLAHSSQQPQHAHQVAHLEVADRL